MLRSLKKYFFSPVKIIAAAAVLLLAFVGTQFYRHGPLFFGIHLNPPQRAFYYWKTQWEPTPELLTHLEKNEINQLYMRFFDVEWNSVDNVPRPQSTIDFLAPLPKNVEVIPVVYITNSVFIKIPYKDVEDLANKVWAKVSQVAKKQDIKISQIQLDCDWSDRSRRSYFHFADLLRDKLNAQNVQVSSTIRLHQIKYAKRTGVPPVNRGMLMFYNFGRIKADSLRSSIFNVDEAQLYSRYIYKYKLPLDISLPIFSWVVHSRDRHVIGLIDKMDTNDFKNIDGFEITAPHRVVATKSFFYQGNYYMKGDLLAIEETTPEVTKQAADLAIQGADWKKTYKTVAFFDMDERNFNRYGNNEIQKIFKQF